MSSLQLYPEVRDASSLGPRFSSPLFLPVGVEGQASAGGTANVGQIYQINRPSDSDTLFGAASSLSTLIKFIMDRGIAPVLGAASVKGASPPVLADRQAAWANFESNSFTRVRMTDSTAQADLVALAVSCNNADLLFNKQVGFGGLAAGQPKSALLSAATAIGSKRFCLVGPGVYDANATLLSGNLASAAVAAEVSRNPDITDDLDTLTLPNLTGIELDTQGMPIFRKRVVTGSAVNDLEDLLQGGVTPLQNNRTGTGVQITHPRTTWTVDGTFDALMTRLIIDQVFIDVRDYATGNNYLRRGNTPQTRGDLAAGINGLLSERNTWILPVTQADGTLGYSVGVIPTNDNRAVIISYSGVVVRNIQTIQVDARLSIPV